MEVMQELKRTEELLHKGIKEINDKGDLNNASLDILGKTLDAYKDLCEIKEKDNPSYGRSYRGYEGYEGYGARRGRDGDGDGRYNESYRGYEGRGYEGRGYGENYGNRGYGDNYGNRGGYGRMYGHNEDIVEGLRKDMQNAKSEEEREYIRKMIRKYEG